MKYFIVVLTSLTITGCATTDTLKPGNSGSTKFNVSGKSYDQVWKASVRAMSTNLTIVEKSKEQGYIKSEKGVGMATWGEVVGVFISPANKPAEKYQVEVQSFKRSRLQITGQDWTQTVVTNIETELDQ
jgi:hypothetical protein